MSQIDRFNEGVKEYNDSIEEDEGNGGFFMHLELRRGWIWGLALLAVLVGVIWGIKALVNYANSDNEACLKAHGHIVESGIDNGKACVDDEWKLIRP